MQLGLQNKSKTPGGNVSATQYKTAKAVFRKERQKRESIVNTSFHSVPKYWLTVEGSPNLQAELALIPNGSKILEIGPGPGRMTEALFQKQCDVTVIELDRELAKWCEPYSSRIILGDVETLDLDDALDETYDVVLFGDVIEHLRRPIDVIRKLRSRISETGFLLACIPNISHGSVRLALLQGKFQYQEDGLLDHTHISFFTWSSIRELVNFSGYTIQAVQPIRTGVLESEVVVDILDVPISVLKLICKDPEATVYQYVIKAAPMRDDEPRVVEAWNLRDENWNYKRVKAGAAKLYKEAGFRWFWNAPAKFRRYFFRAFLLNAQIKTLVYIVISFLPFRLIKPLHDRFGFASARRIISD